MILNNFEWNRGVGLKRRLLGSIFFLTSLHKIKVAYKIQKITYIVKCLCIDCACSKMSNV